MSHTHADVADLLDQGERGYDVAKVLNNNYPVEERREILAEMKELDTALHKTPGGENFPRMNVATDGSITFEGTHRTVASSGIPSLYEAYNNPTADAASTKTGTKEYNPVTKTNEDVIRWSAGKADI